PRAAARAARVALHLSADHGPVGTGHGLGVRALPPAARTLRPGGPEPARLAHGGSPVPRERRGVSLRRRAHAPAVLARARAVVRPAPRPGERRALPALDQDAARVVRRRPLLLLQRLDARPLPPGPRPLRGEAGDVAAPLRARPARAHGRRGARGRRGRAMLTSRA